MSGSRIFDVPFSYKVMAIPVRGRLARPKLLRDSTPVAIATLSSAEAPISLKATLTLENNLSASRNMVLRHDGVTYLRAVEDMPRHAGGERTPFTADKFERMLRWEDDPWAPEYGEQDRPEFFLTTRSRQLREPALQGYEQEHHCLTPDQVLTRHAFEATVRKWEHDGEAVARIATVRSAAEFAFVDDVLYRRVGPPIAAASKAGYPSLLHSDQLDAYARSQGPEANFVAIQHAKVLSQLPRAPNIAKYDFDIWCPMETNVPAALSFVVRCMVPQLKDAIGSALPEMSQAGMEAFRTWRASYHDALEGQFDACLEAMEALRRMAYDETLFAGKPTRDFRELVLPKVALFDRVSRESGYLPISDSQFEQLLT